MKENRYVHNKILRVDASYVVLITLARNIEMHPKETCTNDLAGLRLLCDTMCNYM